MSLVKKIKEILFEEEEVIETVKPVEEPVYVKKNEPIRKTEEENLANKEQSVERERELFKTDNSFRFPDFDEEEFKSSMPKRQATNNVLEYERKKVAEKRNDFGRYERIEKSEVIEKKKFKPSLIISPVYGVLNQDYIPEDVKNKSLDNETMLDLDEVRKKAFEPEEPVINEKSIIDDPVVTFFEEKESMFSSKNSQDEMKSIDELLESASEEEIDLEDELEMTKDSNIDVIEEELDSYNDKKGKDENLEDTLEGDLFELIDSMYDNREDGE